LAAWSGARWGELVALSWDRLDLTLGRMTIDRQLVELRSGNRLHLDTPKTPAGRRTVYLPPHLLPVLEAHRQAHVPTGCAWVFPNQYGQPLRRSSFQSTWWSARENVGLPALHFHDLRHTGNTLAASTGASTRELMARMGHASMQAALIYQHATAERDEAIAKALSQIALSRAVPLVATLPGLDTSVGRGAMPGS
jgi:integrase